MAGKESEGGKETVQPGLAIANTTADPGHAETIAASENAGNEDTLAAADDQNPATADANGS